MQYQYRYSICTIVNNMAEYEVMKKSYEDNGFTDNCEYIIADNCDKNVFDAYDAINKFVDLAKGEFVIITHQDIRCIDSEPKLKSTLQNLALYDKNWAVCGNAGGVHYKKMAYCINDNGDIKKTDNLPTKVFSLDENLLIINSKARLGLSSNIGDFHFYGTDICIVADMLGYSCYVIDFMVLHLSSGNLKSMYNMQPSFIEKYASKFRGRLIQTSCTKFYLSNSRFKNKLYNTPFIFFWIKAFARVGLMIKSKNV
jgi:hypothetical protein